MAEIARIPVSLGHGNNEFLLNTNNIRGVREHA